MRSSNEKPKENPCDTKKGTFENDFSSLQQHVKQLEVHIKRLRELVKSNRSSN